MIDVSLPLATRRFGPAVPHARSDRGTLAATLVLAIGLHFVLIFAWVATHPEIGRDGWSFFPDVRLVVVAPQVELVRFVEPPPPPPPVRERLVPPPPPAPVPPPAPAAAPSYARPAPDPREAPRIVNRPLPQAPTARSGTQSIAAAPPGPLPASNGSAPPAAGGNSEGPAGNGPGGTGSRGGTGKGPGAPEAPPSQPHPPGKGSVTLYDNWGALHHPQPHPDPSGGVLDWRSLCALMGMSYEELCARPHVAPFFTGALNPTLDDQRQVSTRVGVVHVRVLVSREGTAKPTLVKGTADKAFNEMCLGVAERSFWLPALSYGSPVEATVEYDLEFYSQVEDP